MKAKQSYIVIAVVVVTAAVFAWAGQNVQDANAQNTVNQTQTQSDQLDRTDNLREKNLQDTATRPRSQARTGTAAARPGRPMKHLKASELAGMNVRGMSGDDAIGEIKDVVIGHDGKVVYVAVSFGGFLGLGDKLFALPFEAVEFVRDADDPDETYARMDVTEETLKNKPGFNEDNWPDEADQSFFRQGARTARKNERPIPPAGNTQVPR